MPRKSDKIPLKSQFFDRRVKLLECQKMLIKYLYSKYGYSITQLAKDFGVNKRLVQFILFPERKEANIQHRHDRGGTKVYYNKAKNTKAQREHRDYKKNLFKKLNIKE